MSNGLKKKSIHNSMLEPEIIPAAQSNDTRTSVAPESALAEAFRDFNLKSEYFEKNVELQRPDPEAMSGPVHTQVKVYSDSDVQTIDPKDLKEIIKKTKGIKQVVVEKISVEDATRVSLLFEPKEFTKNEGLLEDHERSFGLLQGENKQGPLEKRSVSNLKVIKGTSSLEESDNVKNDKSFNLEELERVVNGQFMGLGSRFGLDEEQLNPLYESKEKNEEGFLSFYSENNKVKDEIEDEVKKEINEKIQVKARVEKEEALINDTHQPENKAQLRGINLKLQTDTDYQNEGHDDNREEKKVVYKKHTFTRKKGNVHNGHYYRAKDHMELFKVGSSYMKDFRNGLKSFSFASSLLEREREKTVFGISTYFNYHSDINTLIVVNNFDNSFYREFLGDIKEKERETLDEGFTYKVYTGKGFDIIDFAELKRVERKIREYDFEYFLDFLIDGYDLTLWDLPPIEVLDSNKELYFPIIRSLDNVSLIVGENRTKMAEINKMISYFKRYQISIKGLLFSRLTSKKEGESA